MSLSQLEKVEQKIKTEKARKAKLASVKKAKESLNKIK